MLFVSYLYDSRCKYIGKEITKEMEKTNEKIVFSLTIVAVVAILSMMVCSLAALGYNSRISMEKEKIEVDTQSNFNQK